MENHDSANLHPTSIYTLAQSRTEYLVKPAVILRGRGSEINSLDYGNRKGKKKMISQIMALNLIDIAKEKGRDVKPFWNTYHCLNRVIYSEGKIYGNYCKNRFCTICTAIRKAKIINSYFPVLSQWEQPYFVTLTVKACDQRLLKRKMGKLNEGLKKIISKYTKRNQRGKENSKLMGSRSLECNFNPVKKTYNPHLHLIVHDKQVAEILIAEWLRIWTPNHASRKAQYLVPITNLENALIEIIKYGSKIFTEPELNRNIQSKESVMIYAKAFYNIIDAMKGLRIFDRFGFNLPKKEESHQPAIVITDYQEWLYLPEYHDWQNTENELMLTGYEPDKSLVNLLEWNVNKYEE